MPGCPAAPGPGKCDGPAQLFPLKWLNHNIITMAPSYLISQILVGDSRGEQDTDSLRQSGDSRECRAPVLPVEIAVANNQWRGLLLQQVDGRGGGIHDGDIPGETCRDIA